MLEVEDLETDDAPVTVTMFPQPNSKANANNDTNSINVSPGSSDSPKRWDSCRSSALLSGEDEMGSPSGRVPVLEQTATSSAAAFSMHAEAKRLFQPQEEAGPLDTTTFTPGRVLTRCRIIRHRGEGQIRYSLEREEDGSTLMLCERKRKHFHVITESGRDGAPPVATIVSNMFGSRFTLYDAPAGDAHDHKQPRADEENEMLSIIWESTVLRLAPGSKRLTVNMPVRNGGLNQWMAPKKENETYIFKNREPEWSTVDRSQCIRLQVVQCMVKAFRERFGTAQKIFLRW
ncbi:hypothetical protein CYMTET_15666 [Cymbomonas tetramitiformis]|uniref:Tubby C-terminal domain-containing protein n=1 Tax=Cymbomonas tetramitiformis TaxID=36881 RepID=A0AAE0GDJ2_9CHLO|nr:hypothetical protein CYMTET_15666 [Cymbomonas tetramitiformis]